MVGSLRRGKKRRLRIPDDGLRQFLERRRVYWPSPRDRTQRQNKPREDIDFFAVPKLKEDGQRRLKFCEVAE